MPVRIVIVSLLLAVAGCGYSLVGAGLAEAGSIAIRTPENASFEPGLEWVVAQALRRELLRRDSARLVEDPAKAAWVVSGRVLPVTHHSRSFSSTVLSLEEEVRVSLDLDVTARDGSVVELGGLQETERYLASADIEVQRKNRGEALQRVASVLASRFFDALGEALTNAGAAPNAGHDPVEATASSPEAAASPDEVVP